MLTTVVNVLLIAVIVYMVYSIAASNYKFDRQINVYIDETNNLAIVASKKKVSEESIEQVHESLVYTYDEVIMVAPNVKTKGGYRK